MRLAPLVRAAKSFGFCAGLGFRARFFVRMPSCRRRPVVGPPRSCPRPARRGRPRASSRSSSCAPATSPLPPIPPHVTPACPASLPPPRSFPPRIFAEIPFLLRLSRLRPFARPRPLLRSASAHSLVAPTSYSASLLLSAPVPLPPSVLPTPPPLPAKNCYGTILIVP